MEAEAAAEEPEAAPMVMKVPAPMVKKDLVLAEDTPVTVAVSQEVNSSTHRAGDTFKLTVVDDVKIDDTVVIPRGTPATAEVTWRTGKGAFGKSGKMEFAIQSIDLADGQIPVTGEYRQEGEGNTVATGVGVLAIGVFAGFITGKRARLPAGRELMVQLDQPVTFAPSGKLAASYDADAAMAAAAAKTDLGRCKAEAGTIEKEKAREKAIEKCYVKRME